MIAINKLTFHYGKQPLFNNFSLQVESGRIVGLLGKNGAGKSTLLKTAQSTEGIKDLLYQETSPMGYRIIRPATNGNETAIDLELLFNAIIKEKQV